MTMTAAWRSEAYVISCLSRLSCTSRSARMMASSKVRWALMARAPFKAKTRWRNERVRSRAPARLWGPPTLLARSGAGGHILRLNARAYLPDERAAETEIVANVTTPERLDCNIAAAPCAAPGPVSAVVSDKASDPETLEAAISAAAEFLNGKQKLVCKRGPA